MMTLVPSVIGDFLKMILKVEVLSFPIQGKCCEVEGKGLYKVGDVIHTSDSSNGSCSKKTVKCGMYNICLFIK